MVCAGQLASVIIMLTSHCMQAKAWDSLALFFEACAQIEIDDFRDYQKALQVMIFASCPHNA